jgi:hypothetical protein
MLIRLGRQQLRLRMLRAIILLQSGRGTRVSACLGPDPKLLTNTTFDPATRYENAAFVATLLPNSRLLTVHGWGHTTPFLSWAADQAVSLYLLDGSLPDPGTIYEQDYVPFQVTAASVEGTATFKVRAQMPPAQVPEPVRRSVHKKAN